MLSRVCSCGLEKANHQKCHSGLGQTDYSLEWKLDREQLNSICQVMNSETQTKKSAKSKQGANSKQLPRTKTM